MLIQHRGTTPSVHESAYVAPTAVLCGDVVVGPGSRVLHGAVLTAEDGQVRVGRDVVIMENAVVKGRAGHPAVIGDSVLVGPHAHVNGAEVRAGAFIATGASLFPGSVVGSGAEIRVNGVVQVSTTVEAGSVVPIGWVAVGTPATVRPPDQHRDIWAVQRDLDFPGTVYGVPRGTSMRAIMAGQSAFYGAHLDDVVLHDDESVEAISAEAISVEGHDDGVDDRTAVVEQVEEGLVEEDLVVDDERQVVDDERQVVEIDEVAEVDDAEVAEVDEVDDAEVGPALDESDEDGAPELDDAGAEADRVVTPEPDPTH